MKKAETQSGDSRKPDLPGFDDIPRPQTNTKEPKPAPQPQPKPQPAPIQKSEANPRSAPTAPIQRTAKKKKSKFREFIGPDFNFSKFPDTELSMTFNNVYKYLILPVIALLSVILIPVMLTLVEKLSVLSGGYSGPITTVGLCYYSALCIISAVISIYLIYAFDRNKKSALFVNYYYWIFLCFCAFCATGIFWLDYLPEFAYYWHEKGYLFLVLSHYRSLYFIEGIITVIAARIIHIYYSKRCSEFTN